MRTWSHLSLNSLTHKRHTTHICYINEYNLADNFKVNVRQPLFRNDAGQGLSHQLTFFVNSLAILPQATCSILKTILIFRLLRLFSRFSKFLSLYVRNYYPALSLSTLTSSIMKLLILRSLKVFFQIKTASPRGYFLKLSMLFPNLVVS